MHAEYIACVGSLTNDGDVSPGHVIAASVNTSCWCTYILHLHVQVGSSLGGVEHSEEGRKLAYPSDFVLPAGGHIYSEDR